MKSVWGHQVHQKMHPGQGDHRRLGGGGRWGADRPGPLLSSSQEFGAMWAQSAQALPLIYFFPKKLGICNIFL